MRKTSKDIRKSRERANKIRKILLRLLFAILIILLLLLLFGFALNLIGMIDVLTERVTEQSTMLYEMQTDLSHLESVNHDLENIITYQNEQIMELQEGLHNVQIEGNTMKFEMQQEPKIVNVPDGLETPKGLVEVNESSASDVLLHPITITTGIMATLATLGRLLLPIIP